MTITARASRVASGLLCLHAIAIIPAGPMKLVRWSISIVSGLPCEKVRSAPPIVVSGPARRSLNVMACTLAESPCDPFHRKLRQLRCLRRRFDCYRVERTSSRAGVAPAEVQRLSRRTFSPNNERSLAFSTANQEALLYVLAKLRENRRPTVEGGSNDRQSRASMGI